MDSKALDVDISIVAAAIADPTRSRMLSLLDQQEHATTTWEARSRLNYIQAINHQDPSVRARRQA